MENDIRFSVLIPVYNVENYLDECVQSVLSQTYPACEIILVDDGSTDGSSIKCDRYAREFPQIQTYHTANRGQIHARMTALEHASGDYIVMLDSDDLLEKDALEILFGAIARNRCDCVCFNRKRLSGSTAVEPSFHIQEGYETDQRMILRKILIEIPYNAIVLKCAKTEMYKGGDFSEVYHVRRGEDLLQSLDLVSRCRTFEFIDDAPYVYRIRKGSITRTTGDPEPVDFTVRKAALDFIREADVFTADDYDDYRDKCIGLLLDQIVRTGLSKASAGKKKEIFRMIRHDEYYSGFLKKGISGRNHFGRGKKLLFRLFARGMDGTVLILLRMRSSMNGGSDV